MQIEDSTAGDSGRPGRGVHYAVWAIQVLLACLFVFSGTMKFLMPVEKMQQGGMALPGWFLHFIGACEILGGLGLVLPGWAGIQRKLTPLAAGGLVIIMIGAVVVTIMIGGGATAALPAVFGALLATVAWGRRNWMKA